MEKKKIMMIDDDMRTSKFLIEYLEIAGGYSVNHLLAPKEAAEELTSNSTGYDLIILDIMLPDDEWVNNKSLKGGNDAGLVILDFIKNKLNLSIPVLILSARVDNSLNTELKPYDNDDNISRINKPEQLEIILEEIDILLAA